MAARKFSIPSSTLIVPTNTWQHHYSLDILDGKNVTSWCVRKHQEFIERHPDKLAGTLGKGKKKRAKKRMYVKKGAGFLAVNLSDRDYSYNGTRDGWKQVVESADYNFAAFGSYPKVHMLSEENILYMNQVSSRLDKIIRGVCMYLIARPYIENDYDSRERVVGMIYSHPEDMVIVSSQTGVVGAQINNG